MNKKLDKKIMLWQQKSNPTIIEQVEYWISLQKRYKDVSRIECKSKNIDLLLRNYTNNIEENCLAIASVDFLEEIQGAGTFKYLINYLSKISPWSIIAIEDISSDKLINFCKKYNFKEIEDYPKSYYIKKEDLKIFEVKDFIY
jgi:sulfur transfer complex TusBCD TusB component (DsrH family)